MIARVIMLQGTGSSVGKSMLTCGLARALTRRGFKVRPFKPQNMSNNAAVTKEGGEIGRAQALQATACGVLPSVLMNPILLKPQGCGVSQIVVLGHHKTQFSYRTYQEQKQTYFPYVLEAFKKLSQEADIILVEGAGSASEVNLRKNDIANMGFARAVHAPVVIVGDIDRGGVIASIVGTKAVLEKNDQDLVKAFVINKMRGDASLFKDGEELIARKTGWKALGIVPYFPKLRRLPPEDTADIHHYFERFPRKMNKSSKQQAHKAEINIKIAVPIYPTLSNYDDLNPLMDKDDLDVIPVYPGGLFPKVDIILLLGSKATISDLEFLKQQKWDKAIIQHAQKGGGVLGICGGYQMLGHSLSDPDGVEGSKAYSKGIGLLPIDTRLSAKKSLKHVSGKLAFGEKNVVTGYEMHLGETNVTCKLAPFAYVEGQPEGLQSKSRHIMGTYLHGIFSQNRACEAILQQLSHNSLKKHGCSLQDYSDNGYEEIVEHTLDQWAEHCEKYIDINDLLSILKTPSF